MLFPSPSNGGAGNTGSNRLYVSNKPLRSAAIFLVLLGMLFFPNDGSFAQKSADAPIYVVTSYRCRPDLRVAFREYMSTTGVQRFEQWKRQGVMEDYKILFNCFVDEAVWDMTVLLRFEDYVASDKWYSLTDTMPGGLDSTGLAFGHPFSTVVADLGWHGTSTTATADPAEAIYFVIPYEYTEKELYVKYFDAYVAPQFAGWLKSGFMTGFDVLVNHHATGDIWDVLFVLEYKDVESFAHRDITKQAVREDLRANNPAWPVIHELKHSIRIEGRTAITRAILP